jgi:tetratricopeptide (TPR) repeat protein
MTPERTTHVRELFEQAERLDPESRASFLRDACGPDTELLAAVEGLLADSQPTPATVSYTPAHDGATPCAAAPNGFAARTLIGRRIGPYEIRREIGSGGMGSVYLAVRVDDYHQQVALKVMRAGLATDELLQRFRTERQVLAGLNHPHIARLLDGGTAEDGLLYFVMEYIEGRPIDRHCNDQALSARDRARLLLPVCAAVEYAHRHTVVHRDLKPGNVLVTADGSPKVLDFGLAKRLAPEPAAGDRAGGRTETGVILGTPGYMAPEQAGGKSGETGPAADVWALGAILYELLTGRPPFRADTPLDTLMQVLREEPVPPSRLHPKLPRDLETVCLKCLQKEPHKRYPSARALGDDLQRFLDGVPIQARPVGAVARLYRWGRRNPKVAVLSALLLLALVSGFVTVTWLWRVAEARGEEAKRQRDRAEKNFNRVFSAIEESLTQVSKSKELQTEDLLPFRRKLLDAARRHFDQFVRELGDNPRALEQLARAHLRLGQIEDACGRNAEGVAEMRKAVAVTSRLLDETPGSRAYQSLLGLAYEYLGITEHDPAESAKALQRSLQVREEMLRDHPEHAAANRSQLAFNYWNVGYRLGTDRPNEALSWLARARAIREEEARGRPGRDQLKHLAQTCLLMGSIQLRAGRTADALASCRRGVEVYRGLAEAHPDEAAAQIELAEAHLELELALSRAEKAKEGIAALEQARTLLEKLVGREVRPGTSIYGAQSALAKVYFNLAMLVRGNLGLAESSRMFEKTRALCDKLLAVRPSDSDLHYLRGLSCFNLGLTRALQGDETLRLHREARASFEALVRLQPANAETRGYLAEALASIGSQLARRGRHEEAVAHFREAIDHHERAKGPRVRLGQYHGLLAGALRTLKRPGEAADAALRRGQLCRGEPRQLYEAARDLARCIPLAGEGPERRRYADLALAELRAAVAAGYADAEWLRTDDDWEPLRGRAEFGELVRQAQARAKPRP